MRLTSQHLEIIAGGSSSPARKSNIASIVAGMDAYGEQAGLTKPHRLAQYVAQIAHESARFRYDREIWGPTPAQKRYDTRTDLGNTPERDGDGKKYAGHGPIQITGKANTRDFRDWCRNQGLAAPDFVDDPELINTDPWEGLGPIWYWSTRNLNRYADEGNIEMITRRINGGTNGLDDRIDLYVRSALVFLGIELTSGAVKRFQASQGLIADDIAGPNTRAALHKALLALPDDAVAEPAPIPTPSPAPEPIKEQPEKPAEEQDSSAPLTLAQNLSIAQAAISNAQRLIAEKSA